MAAYVFLNIVNLVENNSEQLSILSFYFLKKEQELLLKL